MTVKSDLEVCGSVYPATMDGFKAFLAEANRVVNDGFELVTLVRLEKGIASVFRRGKRVPVAPAANFFDDI
jgi:hypothetical protein